MKCEEVPISSPGSWIPWEERHPHRLLHPTREITTATVALSWRRIGNAAHGISQFPASKGVYSVARISFLKRRYAGLMVDLNAVSQECRFVWQ